MLITGLSEYFGSCITMAMRRPRISRQAEAERDRRAKIIHAEGEFTAADKLAQAAELIQKQPAAIQLRYLQTLVEIGAEKNTTVVFPIPIDIFSSVSRMFEQTGKTPKE